MKFRTLCPIVPPMTAEAPTICALKFVDISPDSSVDYILHMDASAYQYTARGMVPHRLAAGVVMYL